MRGALFIGAAFVGGCSLLLPTDLTGGEVPESAGDGGPAEASLPGSDGGMAVDGDAATDAVAEAGVLACPPAALICDDFERATPGSATWTTDDEIAISAAQAHSPIRSLVVDVGSNDTRVPHLRHVIASPPAKIRVQFRLWSASTPTYTFGIVKIPFGPPNQWDTIVLRANENGLFGAVQTYANSATPTEIDALVAPPSQVFDGKWHLVTMDVDMGAPRKALVVRVDAGDPVRLELGGHDVLQSPAEVLLGMAYRPSDAPFGPMYVDDFVLEPR